MIYNFREDFLGGFVLFRSNKINSRENKLVDNANHNDDFINNSVNESILWENIRKLTFFFVIFLLFEYLYDIAYLIVK